MTRIDIAHIGSQLPWDVFWSDDVQSALHRYFRRWPSHWSPQIIFEEARNNFCDIWACIIDEEIQFVWVTAIKDQNVRDILEITAIAARDIPRMDGRSIPLSKHLGFMIQFFLSIAERNDCEAVQVPCRSGIAKLLRQHRAFRTYRVVLECDVPKKAINLLH